MYPENVFNCRQQTTGFYSGISNDLCVTAIHRNIPTRVVKPFSSFSGSVSSECLGDYVSSVSDWCMCEALKGTPVMMSCSNRKTT